MLDHVWKDHVFLSSILSSKKQGMHLIWGQVVWGKNTGDCTDHYRKRADILSFTS